MSLSNIPSRMYSVVAEVLLLGLQLRVATNLLPPPALRERLISELDLMVVRGRQSEISDGELAEARYAVTAFLDDQILRAHWAHHSEWVSEPLERVLYKTRDAGNHFFVRLRGLLRSGSQPGALEVYYLCIALGFRGAYAESGDRHGLASFSAAARQQLETQLLNASKLAPNVQPKDRGKATPRSNAIAYGIMGICVIVAVLGLAFFKWSAAVNLQEALTQIDPTTAEE